jgi:hypothetical protein
MVSLYTRFLSVANNASGGTHNKTQGIVKGELIVEDNLPVHFKQSMFAKGAKYPIAMRYATELGDPSPDDRIAQPRGVLMKIFNVEGEFLPEGEGITDSGYRVQQHSSD